MKKNLIKSIILFVLIFVNSFANAEDCGKYNFYKYNKSLANVSNITVTVSTNQCTLSFKTDALISTKNTIKIKNCSQCPKIIYVYCAAYDCLSYDAYVEKQSDQSLLQYSMESPSDKDSDEESVIIPGKENDKYSNIETCTDVDVNHIKACGCIPAEVADITSKVYFILRLIGPIILLIIGGFEMAKAIAAQDESAIEKAKKKLVNKFIAAAAIFLVLTIIKFAVSLVADDISGVYKCIDILLDGYVI